MRKIDIIKNLPKEFDFKSNINPYGILYHATREKHRYVITWDSGKHIASYDIPAFHRAILRGEFEPEIATTESEA